MSDFKQRTRDELGPRAGKISSKTSLVGFDGFVDKIMKPVATRFGQGDAYEPIPTLEAFGERIKAAAGKSTNIELYPIVEKLGGNGPIMAYSLLAHGQQVRYIGALGRTKIHPVFEEFAQKTQARSITDPGITHALEFRDGKLMLGTMASLDDITWERMVEVVGEGALLDLFSRADLIAMVNWTMVPNFTSVLHALADRVFSNLGPREQRHFYFDLADPEKRSDNDLRGVLDAMKRFTAHGHVTFGANLKEAQRVDLVLGHEPEEPTEDGLRIMADRLRRDLGLQCVVIHPRDCAACATREDAWYVPGPYTEDPMITTGAGDHFNAGFATGQLLGLSPEASLTLGVCTSGGYVRTGKSPSLNSLDAFLGQW